MLVTVVKDLALLLTLVRQQLLVHPQSLPHLLELQPHKHTTHFHYLVGLGAKCFVACDDNRLSSIHNSISSKYLLPDLQHRLQRFL